MKRQVAAFTLAAAMMVSTVAGCGSKELDGDAVVAEVGGEKITADIANFYARYQQSMYETYYASFLGEDMWSGEVESGVTYEESVKDSVMESLQTMYVIKQHADDYQVALTKKEQKAITKAAKSFVDNNGLEEKNAVSGDQETVETYLTLVTIQSKMYKEMIKEADTKVTDKEAAQKKMTYAFFPYVETDEDGESTELSTDEKKERKSEAEAIAKQAQTASELKKAAEAKGYDVETATFDADTTTPAAELIAAADALKKGESTGVVETTTGCYVAIVTSLKDKEATAAKKESIISERQQEAYADLCETWLKDADATVHESVWKQVDFEKLGVKVKSESEETTE